MMPSQRLRHSSICSASGSARASLSTISELMRLSYPRQTAAQAASGPIPGSSRNTEYGTRRTHSTFRAPHSAIQ
jgi:hypothetical protein